MFRLFLLIATMSLVAPASGADDAGDDAERVYIVAGIYSNMQGAIDLERRLEQVFTGVQTDSQLLSGSLYNRVLIGPIRKENFQRLRLLLQAQGVDGAWPIAESEINIATGTREAEFIQPFETRDIYSRRPVMPAEDLVPEPLEVEAEAGIEAAAPAAEPESDPVTGHRVRIRMTGQSSREAAASEAADPTTTRVREPYNPATLVLPPKKDS